MAMRDNNGGCCAQDRVGRVEIVVGEIELAVTSAPRAFLPQSCAISLGNLTLNFATLPTNCLSLTSFPLFSSPTTSKPCRSTASVTMSAALTTNVDQRLLRTTKFPPEFNTKVDLKKVNVQLIKAWVGEEIARILKSEDDVVTEMVNNILEESRYVSPDVCHWTLALQW